MRAVVGLSGGVDSSLAAALAVEAGYEAIGVGVRNLAGASRCCSLDDARRVCRQLGMRFYAVDRVDGFRRDVMEPFADAYLAGRTPLPCAACNRSFKFDVLLARARSFGAERVVTGHFARVEPDPATGKVLLRRGVDRSKDQSYFLFQLDQGTLERVWFPLGGLGKSQVRDQARARGLVTADKPESQEICFVPDGDYASVVEELRPGADRPGAVVDESGRTVGRHAGVHRFTVGQRRGLGVATGRRTYVTALDAQSSTVRVGPEHELAAHGARLRHTSWIAGEVPAPFRAEVQVRYRHAGAKAWVEPRADGGACVRFDEPVNAVSPGQAAVFYDGDTLLGGGFIDEALR